MRWFRATLAISLIWLVVASGANASVAHSRPTRGRAFEVVVFLPEAEVRANAREGAIGLGVYPDSRSAVDFWNAVAAGAPVSVGGRSSPLGGIPCSRGGAIRGQPLGVSATAPRDVVDAADRVLCLPRRVALADRPKVLALGSFEEFANALRSSYGDGAGVPVSALVLGVGAKTPITIVAFGNGQGTLSGGISHRPAIVTPYDLTASIGSISVDGGLPVVGTIGHKLGVARDRDAIAYTDALAKRMERDAGIGHGVSAATISILLGGGIMLTGLLLLLRLPSLALRTARGGAAGVIGYVASLFVQTSNAGFRAIPIVVAFVLGAGLPIGNSERTRNQIGILFGVASAAIAILTVAAALRPGGEPALSLWGDPLVSWRLYGLRNHLSSMLQLGVLSGAALATTRRQVPTHIAAAVLGAVVVGDAWLGANFVAVFTLTLGAALVAIVLVRNRVTIKGLVFSGIVAVAAFVVALLADSGSPASHGGQAVRRVSQGGLKAAWDYVDIRWRLNIHEIRNLFGGWAYALLLVIGLAAVIVWAVKDQTIPIQARAVMIGAGAAALAALLAEDTGFLAGGIIALAPGVTAATVLAERLRPRYAPATGDG